ncbi:MAG: hypothetical protein M0R80_18525 [Proteobacteria bacterium]|jgi:hypothetical protein|nr:hypothetical protein [Pseudomonadota bacterium]
MDITALLNLLTLGTIVVGAGIVMTITKVLTAIPVDWFSDRPKVTAWLVSSVLVIAIGIYTNASVATMIEVTTAFAIASHGLYDVIVGIYRKLVK